MKGRQGFASMDPARVKAIASLGGQTSHVIGSAHEWTPDEARAAGRKGGLETGARRRSSAMRWAHEHLMDAIQAGRSEDAYGYARLLVFFARKAPRDQEEQIRCAPTPPPSVTRRLWRMVQDGE